MIEYDLVSHSEQWKFIEAVNEKLREGWKLQGGLYMYGRYFFQAIYREVTGYEG